MTIDELRPEDWPACARIYEEGLDVGTFEETVPSWEEWDASHLAAPRLVARDDDAILGWAALAPVSRRECYRGVTENSVYVAPAARGRGVGQALLERARPPRRRRGRLDDPGRDPRRQRRLGRAARALRLPGRRHPRADRAEARRVARRRADGAPRAVTAVSQGLSSPGRVASSRVSGSDPETCRFEPCSRDSPRDLAL